MKINNLLFAILCVFGTYFSVNAQTGPITEICVATVDTSSNHNIIVWERVDQISVVGIDSILVYRKTLQGNDSLIATVDYDSLSEYHDYDANPNLKAWTYRIAGKDNNGDIGPLSAPARTIHFVLMENSMNELWLRWTPYIGKTFNFYQCWDMAQANNPLLINSTVDDIDTAWMFSSAQNGINYEMKVDVDWVSGCTSTKANHNTTRSNKATIAFSGTGGSSSIEENTISKILLSPNPSNGLTTLKFSSSTWKPINIAVYDLFGRKVTDYGNIRVLGQFTQPIDLSNLSNGIYQIVIDNGTRKSLRLVKN